MWCFFLDNVVIHRYSGENVIAYGVFCVCVRHTVLKEIATKIRARWITISWDTHKNNSSAAPLIRHGHNVTKTRHYLKVIYIHITFTCHEWSSVSEKCWWRCTAVCQYSGCPVHYWAPIYPDEMEILVAIFFALFGLSPSSGAQSICRACFLDKDCQRHT